MTDSTIVAFIFARGGSKGIPRKNLRDFGGKPLLAHAIATAQAISRVSKVILSTDDQEIAAVGRACGALVPFMRPDELSTDQAAELLAWRHALAFMEQSGEKCHELLVLPVTAPLRTVHDVDVCLDTFFKSQADVVMTVREPERNPYFNMVKQEPDGAVSLAVLGGRYHRRQDAPSVYDVTTVAYVAKSAFVHSTKSLFEGVVEAVLIPRERAIDIDTDFDLNFARHLLETSPSAPLAIPLNKKWK